MRPLEQFTAKVDARMKKITKHRHVHFTDRGNSAIFMALAIAKQGKEKPVLLIPDQGGWYSYKNYPKYFGYEVVEVKTDHGVIDLEDLKTKVKGANAFIFTSFAGYFAEQPLKKIKTICKKTGCLVIEDASGAIGDKKLCNGNYSDIIVGSFGKWKPVNYGYGGWISVADNSYFDSVREVMSMSKMHERFYRDILKFIRSNKLNKLLKLSEIVKEDLKEFEVLHPDKRGINVTVKFDPKVISYCQEKGFQHVLCPNYIRVNERAISIELKRLELDQLKELVK